MNIEVITEITFADLILSPSNADLDYLMANYRLGQDLHSEAGRAVLENIQRVLHLEVFPEAAMFKNREENDLIRKSKGEWGEIFLPQPYLTLVFYNQNFAEVVSEVVNFMKRENIQVFNDLGALAMGVGYLSFPKGYSADTIAGKLKTLPQASVLLNS